MVNLHAAAVNPDCILSTHTGRNRLFAVWCESGTITACEFLSLQWPPPSEDLPEATPH